MSTLSQKKPSGEGTLGDMLKDAQVLDTIIREYERKLDYEVSVRNSAQSISGTLDRKSAKDAARQLEFSNKRVEVLATELVKFLKRQAEIKERIFKRRLDDVIQSRAMIGMSLASGSPATQAATAPPAFGSPLAQLDNFENGSDSPGFSARQSSIGAGSLPTLTRNANPTLVRNRELEELRRKTALSTDLEKQCADLTAKNTQLEQQLEQLKTTLELSEKSENAPANPLPNKKDSLIPELDFGTSLNMFNSNPPDSNAGFALDKEYRSSVMSTAVPVIDIAFSLPSTSSHEEYSPPPQQLMNTPMNLKGGSLCMQQYLVVGSASGSLQAVARQVVDLFRKSATVDDPREIGAAYNDTVWRLEAKLFDMEYEIAQAMRMVVQLKSQQQQMTNEKKKSPGNSNRRMSGDGMDFDALLELFILLLYITSGEKEKLRVPSAPAKSARASIILDLMDEVRRGGSASGAARRSMAFQANPSEEVFARIADYESIKARDLQSTKEVQRLQRDMADLEAEMSNVRAQLIQTQANLAMAEEQAKEQEERAAEAVSKVAEVEASLAAQNAREIGIQQSADRSADPVFPPRLASSLGTPKPQAVNSPTQSREALEAELAEAKAANNETRLKMAQLAEFTENQKSEYGTILASLRDEIVDIALRNEELQTMVDKMHEDKEELSPSQNRELHLQDLEEYIKQLESTLDERDEMISRSEKTVGEYREELARLTSDAPQDGDGGGTLALKAEIQTLENRYLQSTQLLRGAEDRAQQLEKELKDLQQINALDRDIAQSPSRTNNVHDRALPSVSSEVERLNALLAQHKTEISTLETKLCDIQEHMAALEQSAERVAEIEAACRDKDLQLLEMSEEIDSLKQVVEAQSEDLRLVRSELTRAEALSEQINKDENAQGDRSQLEELVQRHEEQIAQLTILTAEKNADLESMKIDLDLKQNALAAVHQSEQETQSELVQLNELLNDYQLEIDSNKATIDRLTADLEKSQKQCASTARELSSAQGQFLQRDGQMAKLQQELESTRMQSSARTAEAEASISALKIALAKKDGDLVEQSERISALTAGASTSDVQLQTDPTKDRQPTAVQAGTNRDLAAVDGQENELKQLQDQLHTITEQLRLTRDMCADLEQKSNEMKEQHEKQVLEFKQTVKKKSTLIAILKERRGVFQASEEAPPRHSVSRFAKSSRPLASPNSTQSSQSTRAFMSVGNFDASDLTGEESTSGSNIDRSAGLKAEELESSTTSSTLSEYMNERDAEIKILSADLAQNMHQLKEVTASLQEKEDLVSQLQDEMKALRGHLDARLMEEQENDEAEAKALQLKLNALEAELQTEKANSSKLAQQVQHYESLSRAANEKLREMEDTHSDDNQSKSTGLEELAQLLKEEQELSKEQGNQIASLKEHLAIAEQKLHNTDVPETPGLERLTEKIQFLETRAEEMQAERDDLIRQLEATESAARSFQGNMDVPQTPDLESLTEKTRLLEMRAMELQAQRDDLEKQLEAAEIVSQNFQDNANTGKSSERLVELEEQNLRQANALNELQNAVKISKEECQELEHLRAHLLKQSDYDEIVERLRKLESEASQTPQINQEKLGLIQDELEILRARQAATIDYECICSRLLEVESAIVSLRQRAEHTADYELLCDKLVTLEQQSQKALLDSQDFESQSRKVSSQLDDHILELKDEIQFLNSRMQDYDDVCAKLEQVERMLPGLQERVNSTADYELVRDELREYRDLQDEVVELRGYLEQRADYHVLQDSVAQLKAEASSLRERVEHTADYELICDKLEERDGLAIELESLRVRSAATIDYEYLCNQSLQLLQDNVALREQVRVIARNEANHEELHALTTEQDIMKDSQTASELDENADTPTTMNSPGYENMLAELKSLRLRAEVTSDYEHLTFQLQEANKELATLQERCDNTFDYELVCQKLAECMEQVSKLQEHANEELVEESSRGLASQLPDPNEQTYENLKAELEELRAQSVSKSDYDDKTARLTLLNTELLKLQERVKATSDYEDICDQLADCVGQLASIEQRHAAVSSTSDLAQGVSKESEDQIDLMRDEDVIANMKSELETLRNQAAATADREYLCACLAQVQSDIAAMQERVSITADYETLREQVAGYASLLAEIEKEASQGASAAGIKDQFNVAQAELEDVKSEFAEAQVRLANSKGQLVDALDKIEDLKLRNSELSEVMDLNKKEFAKLQEQFMQDLQDLQAQYSKSCARNETLSEQIEVLEENLEKAKSEAKAREIAAKSVVDAETAAKEEKNGEGESEQVSKLLNETTVLKEKLANLQAEMDDVLEKNMVLVMQLSNSN